MTPYTQDSFFGDDANGASDADDREATTPSEPAAAASEVAPEPAAEPVSASAPGADDDIVSSFFDDAPKPADATSSVMPDPGQDAVDAFFGPTRIERARIERPPLVPRWAWIAGASVIGVIVLVVIAFIFSASTASISVPQLVGIDAGTATTRLASQGLALTVAEKRFSGMPAETVLSQNPASGTKLKRGEHVSVVISAGSEQFALPAVVGKGLMLARGLLEARGLDVRVEAQPSQQPSDTVLASNPAAGMPVHTGDIVRLTVSATGPTTALLLPYDMTGVKVVIDPAPVNDALSDVPLDVARRLRSLIEASHGTVIATRALADTSTLEAEPARAARAAVSTATVAIGLSVLPSGAAGMVIYSPSPVLANATASAKLVSRIASDLATESGTVRTATSTTDTVLAAARAPWARIQLGSFSQKVDAAKFSDGAWEDSVARALYRSLASLYGKKSALP
jgi:hypothetical protein